MNLVESVVSDWLDVLPGPAVVSRKRHYSEWSTSSLCDAIKRIYDLGLGKRHQSWPGHLAPF